MDNNQPTTPHAALRHLRHLAWREANPAEVKQSLDVIEGGLVATTTVLATLATYEGGSSVAYAHNTDDRTLPKFLDDLRKGGCTLISLVAEAPADVARRASVFDEDGAAAKLLQAARALDTCNWFDADPSSSDELAEAKAMMRQALNAAA